jgi:hypothetical protein
MVRDNTPFSGIDQLVLFFQPGNNPLDCGLKISNTYQIMIFA